MESKARLTHIKKTDQQSMDANLSEIKVLVDSLVAIQCLILSQDVFQYA